MNYNYHSSSISNIIHFLNVRLISSINVINLISFLVFLRLHFSLICPTRLHGNLIHAMLESTLMTTATLVCNQSVYMTEVYK